MVNLYINQDKNIQKTWIFLTMFFVLIIFLGWFCSIILDDPNIILIAFVFAISLNFYSYWFSDRVILRLHKAKPATREQNFELWNITENLAITAGLPMPKIYIIEDESPNAFATGRNKDNAVVAVTTGLLAILDKSELEGVIAHELAHIGNKDMLLSTMIVVMVGFISLISEFLLRVVQYTGIGDDKDTRKGLLIVIIFLAIISPIVAFFIQMVVSRKREFLADATGAMLTRYPEGLANALKKISTYSQPLKTANDVTAHLFISNPFTSKKISGFHKLFLTHPPVEERISALMGTKI